MSPDIKELEARLKALLSKVDTLLDHPPENVPPPSIIDELQKEKSPLLLSAPVPKKKAAPPAPVPEEVRETISLPPPAPPLQLQAPVIQKKAEPPPPVPDEVRETIPLPPPAPPSQLQAPDVIQKEAAPPPQFPPGEGIEIPFFIVYPETLASAAQELEGNLNRLEPKFTKMKFHLRGRGSLVYSADHPLSENALSHVQKIRGGVLLIITRHRLTHKTPHPIGSEMARLGIYFQEILLDSISKKAFYFDFLLGLVFFLKSQKILLTDPTPEPPKKDGPVDWNGLRKRD